MKGISVWIWVVASFIIGLLMFAISLQFIGFVTTSREKELARGSLDYLTSNVNGLCTNRVGTSLTKTAEFPETVTKVFVTNDIRNIPRTERSYGNNLCMNISSEIICNNLNCKTEMENIVSGETLQSLLNQFLGRFGTNSYVLQIQKTDCGVAVLPQSLQSTCGQTATTTGIV